MRLECASHSVEVARGARDQRRRCSVPERFSMRAFGADEREPIAGAPLSIAMRQDHEAAAAAHASEGRYLHAAGASPANIPFASPACCPPPTVRCAARRYSCVSRAVSCGEPELRLRSRAFSQQQSLRCHGRPAKYATMTSRQSTGAQIHRSHARGCRGDLVSRGLHGYRNFGAVLMKILKRSLAPSKASCSSPPRSYARAAVRVSRQRPRL